LHNYLDGAGYCCFQIKDCVYCDNCEKLFEKKQTSSELSSYSVAKTNSENINCLKHIHDNQIVYDSQIEKTKAHMINQPIITGNINGNSEIYPKHYRSQTPCANPVKSIGVLPTASSHQNRSQFSASVQASTSAQSSSSSLALSSSQTLPSSQASSSSHYMVSNYVSSKSELQAIAKIARDEAINNGIEAIKSRLTKLKNYGCVICNLNGEKRIHEDGISGCPLVKKDNLCYTCLKYREIGKCGMKRAIKACYFCGLPKIINGVFFHETGRFGPDCNLNFSDMIQPLCWSIWRNPEKRRVIMTEFSIPLEEIRQTVNPSTDDRAFNEWMFKISSIGMPNTLRLLNLAIHLNWISIN